ncbi:hypothetical protein PAPYR_3876 [Paratrimastix pyriformis]|uniref:GYF domain-containing protein n=1 Tax=Paratrimastix pyriformis TaxID=342808 RepID=A0ABQ8ULS8_9EUKA|nr:hypothetical protein PAPYR_3876 [Paratrimastix pyriformis]
MQKDEDDIFSDHEGPEEVEEKPRPSKEGKTQEHDDEQEEDAEVDRGDIEMNKFEVDSDDEKIKRVPGEERWKGHRSIDGIPVTPFNLDEEKLEGDFEAGGAFVWRKREFKERHLDAWYDEFLEKQSHRQGQMKGTFEVAPEQAADSDDERERRAEERRRNKEKTHAQKERLKREAREARAKRKAEREAAGEKVDEEEDEELEPSASEEDPDEEGEDEADPDIRAANRRDREASAAGPRGARPAGEGGAGGRAFGDADEADEEGPASPEALEAKKTALRRHMLELLRPGENAFDALRRLKRDQMAEAEALSHPHPQPSRTPHAAAAPQGVPQAAPAAEAPAVAAPAVAAEAALPAKRPRGPVGETDRPVKARLDFRERVRLVRRGRSQGLIEELTECADRLMELRCYDAYSDRFEKLQRLVAVFEAARPSEGPSVSVTAPGAMPAPAEAPRHAALSSGESWEYKWTADAAESFGPFTTPQLLQWRAQGLFNRVGGPCIWLRRARTAPDPTQQQWVEDEWVSSDKLPEFLPLLPRE